MNDAGEFIAFILIHVLAFYAFFVSGEPSATQPHPASISASESKQWSHVADYAERLEQKAANAERYFR